MSLERIHVDWTSFDATTDPDIRRAILSIRPRMRPRMVTYGPAPAGSRRFALLVGTGDRSRVVGSRMAPMGRRWVVGTRQQEGNWQIGIAPEEEAVGGYVDARGHTWPMVAVRLGEAAFYGFIGLTGRAGRFPTVSLVDNMTIVRFSTVGVDHRGQATTVDNLPGFTQPQLANLPHDVKVVDPA